MPLLEIADVFIQNIAPGACGEKGYEPKKLIQKHPKLIYAVYLAMAAEGYTKTKKHTICYPMCESGLWSSNGKQQRYPLPRRGNINRRYAGGMYAVYSGVYSAFKP